jgi:dihydrofolate reductase
MTSPQSSIPNPRSARISIIAAVAENGVIGRDNRMPWHLSDDLKRFKALTMGHHIVMGRRTWESLGRPLPGRTSVVVTRDPTFAAPGCLVAHSLDEAIGLCGDDAEVFVIGGGEVYRQALPIADRIYLTEIKADFEGETMFPPMDRGDWVESAREPHPAAGPQAVAFDFVILDRSRN